MRGFACLFLVAACGGGGDTTPDGAPADGGGTDSSSGCPRDAAPAERTRFVVLAKPYDANANKANAFEVFELSASGTLTRTGKMFELGRAAFGQIVFTPDAEVGMVAQEDGSVGVFRLDAAGIPTVVQTAFKGEFYASRVVIDPDGEHAWILDGNTRENGGGLYRATIGCDGMLAAATLVAPARLPGALAFRQGQMILAAGNVLDSPDTGNDVHLLINADPPTVLGGADAFGDDEAILGGAALTSNGATFLVGDTSFAGHNRVAVSRVDALGITPLAVLSSIMDPQGIVASPFDDTAIVTSAMGDKISILDTGGPSGAWRVRGPVAYQGGNPQLPGDMTSITTGTLRGHVFVSENVSIRHLAFGANGTVTDLGSLALGDGLEEIAGAIGVTP